MTWLCSPSDLPARRSAGSPALLAINVEVSQDSATVVISGELDLTTRPLLIEHLSPILSTRSRRLVLDMAGTSFIDCGSARLIASAARFLPDGRRPVIRHPSRAVRRVLELTGADLDCEIEGAP
jgi:anti-anti-sigma factor